MCPLHVLRKKLKISTFLALVFNLLTIFGLGSSRTKHVFWVKVHIYARGMLLENVENQPYINQKPKNQF